jgi:hypothetical protein
MNTTELMKEIRTDWTFMAKSVERLVHEYDRKRRRAKIDKRLEYCMAYEIKTHRKNTWVIIVSKNTSVEKYKGPESVAWDGLAYYWSAHGLRVIKLNNLNGGFSVYNGHLLKRYNERLGLGLVKPTDIIKCFFCNNGYGITKIIPKGNRNFTIEVCRDGLLLGEIYEDGQWHVHKTFISRDLTRVDQDDVERKLLDSLQFEIKAEIAYYKKEFSRSTLWYKDEIIKGIKPEFFQNPVGKGPDHAKQGSSDFPPPELPKRIQAGFSELSAMAITNWGRDLPPSFFTD